MSPVPRTEGARSTRFARAIACCALGFAALAVLAGSPPPAAADAWLGGPKWFSLGLLAGSAQPDPHLADYQWNTSPHLAWGASAMAGAGRLSAGLRYWTSSTTQSMDIGGSTTAPEVLSSTLDLVARTRVASLLGMRVLAGLSGGWLHLGYHPDQVSIPSGGGSPIPVDLEPIDEWTAGTGLAVMHTVGSAWDVGLGIDYGLFKLDTAHRNGAVIVNSREAFGQWNARIEVARRFAVP